MTWLPLPPWLSSLQQLTIVSRVVMVTMAHCYHCFLGCNVTMVGKGTMIVMANMVIMVATINFTMANMFYGNYIFYCSYGSY
jgi:hypothetical protein